MEAVARSSAHTTMWVCGQLLRDVCCYIWTLPYRGHMTKSLRATSVCLQLQFKCSWTYSWKQLDPLFATQSTIIAYSVIWVRNTWYIAVMTFCFPHHFRHQLSACFVDVFMMVSVSLKNTNCLGMLMFSFAKSCTDLMSVCFLWPALGTSGSAQRV